MRPHQWSLYVVDIGLLRRAKVLPQGVDVQFDDGNCAMLHRGRVRKVVWCVLGPNDGGVRQPDLLPSETGIVC